MEKRSVVFVCTANRGRSLMAEYCLRRLLADQAWGRDVEVKSAGILYEDAWQFLTGFLASHGRSIRREDYYGVAPYRSIISVLQRQGWEAKDYRSQALSPALAGSSTVIVAMEDEQKAAVLDAYPDLAGRVFTLRELTGETGTLLLEDAYYPPEFDPADPHLVNYGEEAVGAMFVEIERCLQCSLARLKQLLKEKEND